MIDRPTVSDIELNLVRYSAEIIPQVGDIDLPAALPELLGLKQCQIPCECLAGMCRCTSSQGLDNDHTASISLNHHSVNVNEGQQSKSL